MRVRVHSATSPGAPSPPWGDAPQVAAVVSLRDGWHWRGGGDSSGAGVVGKALDAATLQDFCRAAGLSGFKLPRVCLAWETLPRTSSGKVRKLEVARLIQQWQQAGIRSKL